ncbi:hypothetical protein ACH5RR_008822 [Cinchona calisaya]|uniref:RNase H type-1 domain-containing protein n=1 Tax=Cinchona calisaya TaxID=153742 RepID=A0ABD3AGD0_9GENT
MILGGFSLVLGCKMNMEAEAIALDVGFSLCLKRVGFDVLIETNFKTNDSVEAKDKEGPSANVQNFKLNNIDTQTKDGKKKAPTSKDQQLRRKQSTMASNFKALPEP